MGMRWGGGALVFVTCTLVPAITSSPPQGGLHGCPQHGFPLAQMVKYTDNTMTRMTTTPTTTTMMMMAATEDPVFDADGAWALLEARLLS